MLKSLIAQAFCLSICAAFLPSFAASPQDEVDWIDAAKNLNGNVNALCVPETAAILRYFAQNACAANPGLKISIREAADAEFWNGVDSRSCSIAIADSKTPLKIRKATFMPFAIKGLIVAVNSSNKVSNISSDQFLEVVHGQINNWSALGGTSDEIKLLLPDGMISPGRPASSESEENPFGIVAHPSTCQCEECQKQSKRVSFGSVPSYWIKGIESVTQQMVLENVSKDPAAITVVDISHLHAANVKFLNIDGSAPSTVSIQASKYALGRQLYLIVPENEGELPGAIAKIIGSSSFSKQLHSFGCLPIEAAPVQQPTLRDKQQ